jgi:tagatose-6-phosphate ketose/aldose isomerase
VIKYLGYSAQELENLNAIWTAKEIEQQPDCWKQTAAIITAQKTSLDKFIAPILSQSNIRIILTGAGTSAFAGRALAPSLSKLTGKRFEAIPTTDLVSNPDQFLAENIPTLVVSFARSGNSPESVAAVTLVSETLSNCYHLVLTCNQDGDLYQNAINNPKHLALLMPEETNDRGFAMTSSFTSMMLSALLIFSGENLDHKNIDRMACDVGATIEVINLTAKQIAEKDSERVVYLGSGGLQGLAQESALKLLELTAGNAIAWFDSPLGFRHGPKSIVNSNTMIILYISNDPYTRQYDLDLLRELSSNNIAHKIIAITAQRDPKLVGVDYVYIPNMSSASDAELLFPYMVFAQIYAFHRSLALGLTTDNPCPTGEVNRVVQGVKIYSKDV